MNLRKISLISLSGCMALVLAPAYAKFIETNKLEGIGNIGLQLNENDQVVSLKSNGGRPIVNMMLNSVQELVKGESRFVKIEVFKTTGDDKEFVGAFNYNMNARHSQRMVRVPLPKFLNQSENYEFHVYDTQGLLKGKFMYSFSAAELVVPQPEEDALDPELDTSLSDAALESIMRNLSVRTVSSAKLAGIEKDGDRYVLNIPDGQRASGVIKGKKISALQINAFGTLQERTQYDDEKRGFVFLDNEKQEAYIKGKEPGSWSNPIPFVGEAKDVDLNDLNFDQINDGTISLSKIEGGDRIVDLLENPPAPVIINQGSSVDLSPINTQINNLNNQKLNNDLSNLASDIVVNGKIKTNNVDDKTLSLGLDGAVIDEGAVRGKVAQNTIRVIRFANTDSSASWTVTLPKDIVKNNATGNNFKLRLLWSPSNDLGENVDWELKYSSYDLGQVLTSPNTATLRKVTSAPAEDLALAYTEFDVQAENDTVLLMLTRKDANNIQPNLVAVEINYPALSLEKI